MKRGNLSRIAATLALCAFAASADAGPLKLLKEAGEFVLENTIKKPATASRLSASDLKKVDSAALKASRQTAEEIVSRKVKKERLDKLLGAAQIGVYSISGAVLMDSLISSGYALAQSDHENQLVLKDIEAASAQGETVYFEQYCRDSTGTKFVVPREYVSCGDGSAPKQGNGIAFR